MYSIVFYIETANIFSIGEIKTYFHRLYYKPGTWLDGYPTLIYGDGDGTVNRRSLEGCVHWQTLQKQKVYTKELPKVDHLQILHDKTTLSYITGLVKHYSKHKKPKL